MSILTNLPNLPGVYIYKDLSDKIIYIGKAINLKKRVSQYFQRNDALGPKTLQLVSQISNIEYKTVNSELEALILEAKLVKKYRPKYNTQLKDDKSYIYICISNDKYPIIYPAHKSKLNESSIFYGPFPSSSSVRNLLKTIRKIFPFYTIKHSPTKKCLYCHLGLCPGPNISVKDYKKNVNKIKKILNGKFENLLKTLTKEMKVYSKAENYELAQTVKNQIDALNYIVSGWKSINVLFSQINLPEDQVYKSEVELKSVLSPYFPNLNNIKRIEAFDISNLGNNYFVGSMVVYQDGKIDKNKYRKFKINAKVTPDDQFMIKEIVYRRLKHPEWQFPSIILVDGGKPQVSAAISVIKNIPIIGLAKKQETIVIKTTTDWAEINLPKNSSSLLLLQRLRDEAHRFANKYRKELMKKPFLK